MENNVIREAIIKIGDKELLRIFDEEQEEMRKKTEEEIKEMIKNGELILESDAEERGGNMSRPKYVEPDDYMSPEMLKAFEEDDKEQENEENEKPKQS